MYSSSKLLLGADDEDRRLDKVARRALKEVPLSAIHRAIRRGDIRINGQRKPPDYRCRAGDSLEYSQLSATPAPEPQRASSERQAPSEGLGSSLSILLETADLLFLNKQAGILAHDGTDSLDAMVRAYLSGKLPPSLSFAPGPLHRLDRNTSGVIAFSKSLSGAKAFSAALRKGFISKTYLGLLEGRIDDQQRWKDVISRDSAFHKSFIEDELRPSDLNGTDSPSGGGPREALTETIPILSDGTLTLAALRLRTGRTHQIRVQAAFHGHPLIGDVKYGGSRCEQSYYLHAACLSFEKPLFDDVPKEIFAPLPLYFLKAIQSRFLIGGKEVYSLLRQFLFQEGQRCPIRLLNPKCPG